MKENKFIQYILNYLGLFSSFSTLICCALPSAMVLLGLGASFASFLNSYPQIIWFSENKSLVFIISFIFLIISFLALRYSEKMVCPIDQKEFCSKNKKISRYIIYVSLGLNLIGFGSAFILPYI